MRRNTPIRITKNDEQEYARLVRNARAKISRTEKNYGVDISGELELPSIGEFKTRKEFNEWKDKQRRFVSRSNLSLQFVKNPYGVVASKREIMDTQLNTRVAQRLADKLLKEHENKPFISGGKEQGTVGQRMQQMARPNTAGITKPRNFDFSTMRSRKQFEDKKRSMEERSDEDFYDKAKERMRDNFINILDLSLNSDGEE